MRSRWFTKSSTILLLVSVVLGTASCSDDAEPPSGGGGEQQSTSVFPRQAVIEYKVTSDSGLTTANVRYSNDTGGETTVDAAALPFAVKVTRSVKQYDVISFGASASAGGSLTLELVVDGKSVDKKTSSGTSNVSTSTSYDFR